MEERLPISLDYQPAPPQRRWDRAAVLSAAMGLTAGPLSRFMIALAKKAGQWPTERALLTIWVILGIWFVIGLSVGILGAKRTLREPARLRGGMLAWLGIITNVAWIVLNAFQAVKHYRGI